MTERTDRPEVEPAEMVSVSLPELLEASYEALKAVLAASVAQIVSPSDKIQAKAVFDSVWHDVDRNRVNFIKVLQEVQAEIVSDEEE